MQSAISSHRTLVFECLSQCAHYIHVCCIFEARHFASSVHFVCACSLTAHVHQTKSTEGGVEPTVISVPSHCSVMVCLRLLVAQPPSVPLVNGAQIHTYC